MTRLHEDVAYHRRAAAHEVVQLGVACAEQDLSELAVRPEFGQLSLEKVYITFDVLWTAQLSWKGYCFASVFPPDSLAMRGSVPYAPCRVNLA